MLVEPPGYNVAWESVTCACCWTRGKYRSHPHTLAQDRPHPAAVAATPAVAKLHRAHAEAKVAFLDEQLNEMQSHP